ncbi:MAG: hypothetical protein ABR910_01175 [Acidobacteriaceae bacterium]
MALFTGCGTAIGPESSATAVTPAVQGIHGTVHGGQQPVTGSTIQLWAVGTTGYGSAGTALISATLTSSDGTGTMDSNANAGNANNTLSAGNFTITGDYTCPSASTLVYLTATGGNPGLTSGTNNSALVLMAALGQCGSLSSSTVIVVNEVTTIASVYALAQFTSTGGSVGSPSSNTTGIASAFSNVNNLVNTSTGAALSSTSGGNTVPQSELDTFADILVPCVNSTGPTSSACTTLFSAATPSGGSAPTTVLAAALDIALNPSNNVTSLFNISTANTAFQPTLSSAPSSWTVIVGGGGSACGYSGSGYTVSGTVSYSGTKTGQIYLVLSGACGGGTLGTSISSKGAYTIRGVPPGFYTLYAYMDTLGYGSQNAADPATGNPGSFVDITSSNLTGQNISLSDPATPTVTSAPSLNTVSGFATGVVAQFSPVTSSSVETPTSYTLQWSTTSSFTAVAGSQTFAANGKHTDVWFVNGLTNGSVYYFRAYGTSAGTSVGPYSAVYGPVTIAAPSTGSTVSGAVTFSAAPTGPMYVGFYNINTSAVYVEYIANPVSMQAYSVMVPNSASQVYQPVAFIDQNNNGILDPGDLQDIAGNSYAFPILVNGNIANENITLPSSTVTATVSTQHFELVSGQGYYLQFQINALTKLPVAVTLESSSNGDGANVIGPMDIASCSAVTSGCGQGFQMEFSLGTTSPTVGDTYFFNVTYSDGTSGTVTPTVTGVLNDFASSLEPITGASTSTTPTFTWTDPADANNYFYQFELSGPTGTIWQIPGNNSNASGFTSAITSVPWSTTTDPTGANNPPTVTSLTANTTYTWYVGAFDNNNNFAITQVSYDP